MYTIKNIWFITAQKMCSILDASQCAHFRWGTFSVVGSCELQKQHLRGKHTHWALSTKTVKLFKVHCLGCHCQAWHHWTILVRRRYSLSSTVWQSTQIDMSRCFVSSGQHLVDGKRSLGSASCSIRTVPPHTPQKNHRHG